MPLYGFVCDECSKDFEELVMSSGSIDQVICPECGSHKVQRQLSMVAGLGSSASTGNSASCSTGGG